MNPVLVLLPADILPDGFVQVKPEESEAVVGVPDPMCPSRGEVKGDRRGGGGMETVEDDV